ncbi:MAG: DUF1002 domain-containing protein [Clostridiales bacterium]|nr:DUF1002 domain-containing protein [Clostridiales bacterium]
MHKKHIQNWKRWVAISLSVCLASGYLAGGSVLADSVDNQDDNYQPYISLGADLKADEKATVLRLLGVSESELSDYAVVTITNEDEHQYLDGYLDQSVIGTRALSSVKVVKTEEGSGIGVETHNISYCTTGMYCNALITAGLEDADVVVAGPFNISGTAALVGAMEAYATMTGQEISKESMDAATNELVLTGELADELGDSEKTEQLIAMVKQTMIENGFTSEKDIQKAIEEASDALDLDLSDEEKEKIVSLMGKISKLDIDPDALKEQAQDIYNSISDKLKNLDFDKEGFTQKVGDAISNFFSSIVDFFKGLFD